MTVLLHQPQESKLREVNCIMQGHAASAQHIQRDQNEAINSQPLAERLPSYQKVSLPFSEQVGRLRTMGGRRYRNSHSFCAWDISCSIQEKNLSFFLHQFSDSTVSFVLVLLWWQIARNCSLNDCSQTVSLSLSLAQCISGNHFKGGCVFHGVIVTVQDVILAQKNESNHTSN